MKRIIIAVAIICALGVFLYWQGGKDTRQSARETTITREKDILEAIEKCSDLPWQERLNC